MLATDPNENNSQVPKKTQYNANKEQGMTNHLWSPERLAKPALTPRRNHLSPASPNPPLSASVCRWRQLSPDPRRTPQYTSETVFLVVLRMALCYSVITVYIYIYIYEHVYIAIPKSNIDLHSVPKPHEIIQYITGTGLLELKPSVFGANCCEKSWLQGCS